jgi:hypothetical protein
MAEEIDKPDSALPEPKEKVVSSSATPFGDPVIHRENTRSQIAMFYLYAFFGTLGVCFFIGFCDNFEVKDYKDILLAVSGVLSGPLGFIIGYYFKAAKE